MASRQQQIAQALLRASDFNASHATDFAHSPATKVDIKFTASQLRIDTATIPAIIDDGKDAKHTLDVLFSNVYASQREVLAAWTTASHSERQNAKKAGNDATNGGNTTSPTPA